jgi:hypothetical protein
MAFFVDGATDERLARYLSRASELRYTRRVTPLIRARGKLVPAAIAGGE